MKTLIFLVAFATFLSTTLVSLAADRKPRLTYREKKAAEEKAVIDAQKAKQEEVRKLLHPNDAEALEILKKTDLDIQKRIESAKTAPDQAQALNDSFQSFVGNTWFLVTNTTGDQATRGSPVSVPHEKYPADEENGVPAMIKVLLRRVRNNIDVSYFVACFPATTEFRSIKFLHVHINQKTGVYVLPVGFVLDGDGDLTIRSLCYKHVEIREGPDFVLTSKIWAPDIRTFQQQHRKLSTTTTVVNTNP